MWLKHWDFVLFLVLSSYTAASQQQWVPVARCGFPAGSAQLLLHRGALTFHQCSTGLKLHFIQQRKGKCSSPFKSRIPLLKIQMQIYQCRKFKKGVTPICQSRFLCCFPDGSADAVLGLQSQPTESKKDMFQDCRYPNTSESICVWCHKMLTFPAPHMLSALWKSQTMGFQLRKEVKSL